jgi:ElaB/YqjD/DUF883 family membrane-anchored ribosome-binding protein
MKTNGERNPAEIQADIERTRSSLDHTLSAIEQRLQPSQLIDQGVDYLRHSGAREYMTNLGTSVKQEPLPLALVGIGLAWLMMSHARGTTAPSSTTASDLSERARGATDTVADSMRGTMSSVRDTAARTSQRISDTTHRIGQTAHAARERASQMGAAARHQAERVRTGYDRLVNEQPLALGAIGLAVGAVLAATAPRTRHEDRVMGDASHRLKESAKEAGLEQFDRASSSVSSSMHAARTETSGGDGFDADIDRTHAEPPPPFVDTSRTTPAAPH